MIGIRIGHRTIVHFETVCDRQSLLQGSTLNQIEHLNSQTVCDQRPKCAHVAGTESGAFKTFRNVAASHSSSSFVNCTPSKTSVSSTELFCVHANIIVIICAELAVAFELGNDAKPHDFRISPDFGRSTLPPKDRASQLLATGH